MKKILNSLFISIGVLAVAQEEAIMEVKAQVIKPLKVEVTKNIDFGKVVAGSFSRVDGEFKVTGEPGEKYIAYIKELGENSGEGTIEMVNSTDSSIKFPVRAWTDLFNFIPTINSKTGYNCHTVGVDLAVPTTQTPGSYTSNLTMIVRYK